MSLSNLVTQVISYVVYLFHSHQYGSDFQQLLILHVINEGAYGHCIFWLEDIGVRGIVNYDGSRQISAQTLQVFHIVALVWAARLPATCSNKLSLSMLQHKRQSSQLDGTLLVRQTLIHKLSR